MTKKLDYYGNPVDLIDRSDWQPDDNGWFEARQQRHDLAKHMERMQVTMTVAICHEHLYMDRMVSEDFHNAAHEVFELCGMDVDKCFALLSRLLSEFKVRVRVGQCEIDPFHNHRRVE